MSGFLIILWVCLLSGTQLLADLPPGLTQAWVDEVERALKKELDYWIERQSSIKGWAIKGYYLPGETGQDDRIDAGRVLNNQDNHSTAGVVMKKFLPAFELFSDERYLTVAKEVGDIYILLLERDNNWFKRYREWGGTPVIDTEGEDTVFLEEAVIQYPVYMLVWLWRLTREDRYLNAAIRGAELVLRGQSCHGGWPEGYDTDDPNDWRWGACSAFSDETHYESFQTMVLMYHLTREERWREAIRRAGDFLLTVQLGPPTHSWAQGYDENNTPCWLRWFEPPAVKIRSTRFAIEALFEMYNFTGEERYLEAIRRSLNWIKSVKGEEGWLGYYNYETGEEIPPLRPGYAERGEWIDVEEIEWRLQGIEENGRDPLQIRVQQFPSQEELAEILTREKGLIEEILSRQREEGIWQGWRRKGEWIPYRWEENQITAPFYSPGDLLYRYLKCVYAYQGRIDRSEIFFRPRFDREKYEIPEWYHDFHRRAWPIRNWFEISLESAKEAPFQKEISLVYPNPFNPECYIPVGRIENKAGRAKVKIYNILGQLVREIEISDPKSQISKSVYWDGRDSHGLEVPAGVYFYEIVGEGVRKMVVLK
jgi:hypothetical protein